MAAQLRMNQAITAALESEMEADPSVIVMGEDVAQAEGVFKTSAGLLARFGPERVRDTPISEMGFLGVAVGAAVAGLRPVVEIMFVEFLGVALDQVTTEAAMMRQLSGGQLRVPLLVRASIGSGAGFGCQHSQTLERWIFGTPGLKLGVVSSPAAAYQMVRTGLQDDNPVVLLEPRVLYGKRGPVETGDPGARFDSWGAEVLRPGEDVTVLALGQTTDVAMKAAQDASWDGEIVDLRWLQPLDLDCVERSVRKTRRLVIVEENQLTGGWGGEVAYRVSSRFHGELRAPVLRVTAPDTHVPYVHSLEERYLPSPAYLDEQISALIKTGSAPRPWWEER